MTIPLIVCPGAVNAPVAAATNVDLTLFRSNFPSENEEGRKEEKEGKTGFFS